MSTTTAKKITFLERVERFGNALPDPMTLFVLGAALVFLVSALAAGQGWTSELSNAKGELLRSESARNLLSAEGFRWLFQNLIRIFVEFRPLGMVLAAGIGIAVAERSGFISTALKGILVYVPRQLLTPATFFAGIMSSMAIDAGYIVLPPLAGAIYKAVGRSPVVGIAAVSAGVASGFNANLLVTGLDPLLAGFTESAARILSPDYAVNPACNLYFMIASTIMITLLGWALTVWYVEPRLAARYPADKLAGEDSTGPAALEIAPRERRGLMLAFLSTLVAAAFLWACQHYPWGFLYDAPGSIGTGEGQTPFPTYISVIVPLLIVLFLVPGLTYGLVTGTVRSDRDVVKMMSDYMALMGNYVVLAFFAAIFVEAFAHSNLGIMVAIEGGNFLRSFELSSWAHMLAFIVVVAFINMFVGSMSAKWAMLATVFVPMFMTIGISPELTQVTYRIGDSVTNSVTPLNPYFVVLLVFMRQYVKNAGLGTLISALLPYAVVFGIAWSVLLVLWIQAGLPLGPDGPLTFTP